MSEPLIVVSTADPALDAKKSKILEYRRTLDAQHLVFTGARRPWRFHVVDLEYDDYQEVLSIGGFPSLAADRAFRHGVVAIEGVPGLGDGGTWRSSSERNKGGQPVKFISPDDMKSIFKHLAPRHVMDVGTTLIERAEMERGDLGNGAGG